MHGFCIDFQMAPSSSITVLQAVISQLFAFCKVILTKYEKEKLPSMSGVHSMNNFILLLINNYVLILEFADKHYYMFSTSSFFHYIVLHNICFYKPFIFYF